jgi:peptidyl-prolyl cis-trans isomerase SurA
MLMQLNQFVLGCSVALALAIPATPVPAQNAQTPRSEGKRLQPLDRIVAVVNDEVLTERELQERLSLVTQRLEKQGTPLPEKAVLARQMLERLIIEALQLQYAKESGIKVDDSQLERALLRIAQDNQMSLTAFRSAVEKDGVSFPKFRDEIRSEITITRIREKEIESKVLVSDEEVDTELQKEAARPQGEAEYQVAHILIRLPEQASAEQIAAREKRANEALQALKKGTDFGQVSATYSDAPEALQGGNLGWRQVAKLPTLYVEALSNLTKGDVSAVLKSGNGFHIIKVLDARGAGAAQAVTQTHVRHILIKTSDTQPEGDAKNRIQQLKVKLDGGADFGELARAFSEDTSASKNGDLGWIYPGDTLPEFERTMDALQPDQISAPVQTPFGWHLIQVLERKSAEASADRNRVAARVGIRQRKTDEAYQDWLRQLRDRAYVEYRLDEK